MIDFAIEKFGKLDILINNAGLMDNFATAESLDTELMLRLMKDLPDYQIAVQRAEVNVNRPCQPTYEAMEEMIRMSAEDPASALEEFAKIRTLAYFHKSPYHYVLHWFRDTYVDASVCTAA